MIKEVLKIDLKHFQVPENQAALYLVAYWMKSGSGSLPTCAGEEHFLWLNIIIRQTEG